MTNELCEFTFSISLINSQHVQRLTETPLLDVGVSMWNEDNAIYADGEWITWTEINSHLARLEFVAEFPNLDVELVPIFQKMLTLAEDYFCLTGKHLQIYGDLGEIYGAIVHGIKLHRNYAQGSDGRLGNDFVEVKTITPFKRNNTISLNLEGNFSKVLIVKINDQFEVSSKLIDRKELPKTKSKCIMVDWNQFGNEALRSFTEK